MRWLLLVFVMREGIQKFVKVLVIAPQFTSGKVALKTSYQEFVGFAFVEGSGQTYTRIETGVTRLWVLRFAGKLPVLAAQASANAIGGHFAPSLQPNAPLARPWRTITAAHAFNAARVWGAHAYYTASIFGD